MVNRVILIGRLTRDPEAPRTTTSGKSVINFTLAVTKQRKPTDGSPEADFFSVTAWGQTAEFVANYLTKGRLVSVDGRLQSRKYTTQDGQNREVVEVVAEHVSGLERPREGDGAPRNPAPDQAVEDSAFDPFAED